MAIGSSANLFDELTRSGILDSAKLDELRGSLMPRYADPKGLARELLQRGWITPYQVNQLFQGNGSNLVLGPYLVLERLGEGGMGQVFKAQHRMMDRIVALKVIRPDRTTDVTIVGRFQREIKAAAQLSHPNIVTAYDAAQVDATLLFAMEFVEGRDLAQLVKEGGPLPIEQACEYTRQAALGLQHAHERGLVHRDIKPSNLLVSFREGGVKILDMGLARWFQSLKEGETATGSLTHPESVMGTPDYISPEQAINSRAVDIRGDIYSLGCSLYYLLTGQAPFVGETMTEKLLKHQLEEAPSIEHLRAGIPSALAAVLARLMAKRPEDRYQTPLEVAEALEPFTSVHAQNMSSTGRIRTDLPPTAKAMSAKPNGFKSRLAHTGGQVSRAVKNKALPTIKHQWGLWSGRYWALPRERRWIITGAAGCLMLVLLVWFFFSGPPLDSLDADDIPVAERFSWQPRELVAVLGEHRKRLTQTIRRVAYSHDGMILATCSVNSNKIHLWDAKTRRELGTLSGHGRMVSCIAFAPDRLTLASGGEDNNVKLWDVTTQNEITTLYGHSNAVGDVVFSPDGKTLASGGLDGTVRLWDAGAATSKATLEGHQGAVRALAFSRDGKTLAAGVSTNNQSATGSYVQLWDVSGQTKSASVPGSQTAYSIYSVAFSGNGSLLAFGLGNSNSQLVRLWDLQAGAERTTLKGFGLHRVAFSPDGKTLATSSRTGANYNSSGEIKLWNPNTGSELASFRGDMQSVTCLAFSPDGATLASGSNDALLQLWDVATHQEKAPRQGSAYEKRTVAFSPDGTMIASGSNNGMVELWDLHSLENLIPNRAHQRRVLKVVFAPDGKTMASSSEDGTIKLWDVELKQVSDTLNDYSTGAFSLRFNTDGTELGIGYFNGLQLWDLGRSKALSRINISNLNAAAFAQDPHTAAIVQGDEISVWDVVKKKARKTFGDNMSGKVAFRYDGEQIAASEYDRRRNRLAIKLFRAGTGKVVRTLNGARQFAACLKYSPDGQQLLYSGSGGQVILWDTDTGEKILEWNILGGVRDADFSPDGRYLATANGNGTIYVLRLK